MSFNSRVIKLEEIIAVENRPAGLHVIYRNNDNECDVFIIDSSQEATPEQTEILSRPGRSITI